MNRALNGLLLKRCQNNAEILRVTSSQVARYTLDECAKTFDVTKRTVKNWENGKIKPPRAVFLCLMVFSGRLDFLGKPWKGFRITSECIESPEGDFVRPNEIRALRYAMQSLEIDRLRRCPMNAKNTPEVIDSNKITFIDKAPKLKKLRRLGGVIALPVSAERNSKSTGM